MGLYAAKSAVLVSAQLGLGNAVARLFLHMSLECWDDEPNPGGQVPRRYFGRREMSAIALGFLAPDNGSEQAFRAVKRAVRELVDKGAVVRTRQGGNGRSAEFALQVYSARPRARSSGADLESVAGSSMAFQSPPQRARF